MKYIYIYIYSLVGRVQDFYTYGKEIKPLYRQSLLSFYFFSLSYEYSYLRPLFFNSLIIFELEIGEGIKARTWVSSEHEKGSNQQH